MSQSLSNDSLSRIADACVACGLCVPRCPTYRKTGSEADSPRGRIALIQGVLDSRIPPNPRFIEHMDLCLTCRVCERVCPNQVRFGELIDGMRERIEKLRPGAERFWSRAARALIARPRLLQSLAPLAALARAINLHGLLPRSKRRETEAWLSTVPWLSRFEEWYPPRGNARGEVALFLGCVARLFDVETLRSTIFVLNKLGYAVRIPKSQTCCGALARHGGDLAQAKKLAMRNAKAFEKVDVVVASATGCGLALVEYGQDHGAHEFSSKVADISAFLARQWQRQTIAPLRAMIAVHEPCTARNSANSLLERIPGVVTKPLQGNDQCCGAAGTYFLTQPSMANALRQDKVKALEKLGAQILVTSNVGCALHFKAAGISVLHPVTLLARQMGYGSSNKP
ncbi:MAG: (Fe-S)-binding protein [Burkholderiales bacterium]